MENKCFCQKTKNTEDKKEKITITRFVCQSLSNSITDFVRDWLLKNIIRKDVLH
jgi:hypothetical protein